MIKTFYRTNKLKVDLPETLPLRVTYSDRLPTPDELSHIVDIAALREKVIVCCLALGGFRECTLSQLKYRHIKDDFERGVVPIHIHVEAEITYMKAGLTQKSTIRRYKVRPHSIRKYFRTQMAALGIDRDYIEYMMGHTVGTYHDIQMKGIEFLRNIASGLSIRPKAKTTLLDTLKVIIKAHGEEPEKYLVRETIAEPHRTYASPLEREQDQVKILSQALKEMLHKELPDTQT